MSELLIIYGDATEPKGGGIKIIPHVCNDEGYWDKGFVLALSKKWTRPEEVYRNHVEEKMLKIGTNHYANCNDSISVVNMVAQTLYNTPKGVDKLRYEHLVECMKGVRFWKDVLQAKRPETYISIHCPMFGSGLAGGDWSFILKLIKQIWVDAGIDVTVYEFN